MLPSSSSRMFRVAPLALSVLVMALAPGCDDGVRLSLQLRTAENGDPVADASALRTLTVIVDNGAINDRESFQLNRADQVLVPPMSVDRATPFNVEVWGCNRDTCDEADVTLRGCTPTALDVRDRSDTVIVTIEMHDFRDNALRQCPALTQ